MQRVKTGKAADMYGDIVELFTSTSMGGQPYLLPHVTRTLNAFFISGKFPSSESAGMIITLYKGKGSEQEGGNYRGITIITALSKIYATLLNLRLTAARLAAPHRHAIGQGGFCLTAALLIIFSCCNMSSTNTDLYKQRDPSNYTHALWISAKLLTLSAAQSCGSGLTPSASAGACCRL